MQPVLPAVMGIGDRAREMILSSRETVLQLREGEAHAAVAQAH